MANANAEVKNLNPQVVDANPQITSANAQFLLVGASHKTAQLDRLGNVSLSPEEITVHLPSLKTLANLREIVILSTCNRTEIYAVAEENIQLAAEQITNWILGLHGDKNQLVKDNLYILTDDSAVTHLFKTICGLDSLILGETEITGQIQGAFKLATQVGTTKSYTKQLFQRAFRVAKRSRSETQIDRGTTSIASASVHLANRFFDKIRRCSVLVVGAGETGQLLCTYFDEHSPRKLTIANRTVEKAVLLAQKYDGYSIALDQLDDELLTADIVVCATHSKQPIINHQMVKRAMANRHNKMLLLIDISLPHNIDISVKTVDGVFLHDMKDLKNLVARNLKQREKEVPAILSIINEEKAEFDQKLTTSKVGPLIQALRERYEFTRQSELERISANLAGEMIPVAEKITRELTNKFLQQLTVGIKEFGQDPGSLQEKVEWSKSLFGLTDNNLEKKQK